MKDTHLVVFWNGELYPGPRPERLRHEGSPKSGYISFQDEAKVVSYKSIRIKELKMRTSALSIGDRCATVLRSASPCVFTPTKMPSTLRCVVLVDQSAQALTGGNATGSGLQPGLVVIARTKDASALGCSQNVWECI